MITGRLICYDNEGNPKDGVKIYTQMFLPPPDDGKAYDSSIREYVSSTIDFIEGIVYVPNLWLRATYYIWRGHSNKILCRIPSLAPSIYDLPPILGNDSADPCIAG